MIRARIPEQDDGKLFQMIVARLMPFAKKVRPETAFNRREIKRRWRDCKVLVSDLPGGVPGGFISFKLVGKLLTIDMLAVDRRAEGRGIGSALMAAAEQYGEGQGAEIVQLAVDEPNAHARRFYARRGYKEEVTFPEHGMIIMSKKLSYSYFL